MTRKTARATYCEHSGRLTAATQEPGAAPDVH